MIRLIHYRRFLSLSRKNYRYKISRNYSRVNSLFPVAEWDRGGCQDTPLMSSVKKHSLENPNAVRLIQVGSFYELYEEQAEKYGPQLGIKVVERNNTVLSGFPVNQLEKYVKMLVCDLGQNVAIIDQVGSEKQTISNILHRRVSRIVSPGTLIDESFLNFNQNNYLLALAFPHEVSAPQLQGVDLDPDLKVGMAWADVSVGELNIQTTTLKNLMSDVARIQPSEIIVSKTVEKCQNLNDSKLADLKRFFIRYHKYNNDELINLSAYFNIETQKMIQKKDSLSKQEYSALKLALSYIFVNLPDRNPDFDFPQRYLDKEKLQIDSRSREALELNSRATADGRSSKAATLFSTIKRTITDSGTRMLHQWINSPIVDTKELKKRHDFVEFYCENPTIFLKLRTLLTDVYDFARSAQRLSLKSGDPIFHMKCIASGLQKAHEINLMLQKETPPKYKDLIKLISSTPLNELSQKVLSVFQSDDDFRVHKEYNQDFKNEHKKLSKLAKTEANFLQVIQKMAHKIDPKLKVSIKFYKKFGDVVHILGQHTSIEKFLNSAKISEKDILDKKPRTLLIRPLEWNTIQIQIENQKKKIETLEEEVINDLRLQVLSNIQKIRDIGKNLDFIDVTSSFAMLAKDENLVRPIFTEENVLNIENGRHLVVENSINRHGGTPFVTNDTKLGDKHGRLWIISGPNMGGKSTYLRQNALIVILAQMGSFVPARKCEMKIVDKIFTRIGASDDISRDLSTFMVEMIETSNILKNATENSLAVVDEIGRGTSGNEGLAIAYATMENLLTEIKCRTLFATHFGLELRNLIKNDPLKLKLTGFYKTRVNEIDSNIIYDHKLVAGISERSYALEVAKKAGFPPKALVSANKAFMILQNN